MDLIICHLISFADNPPGPDRVGGPYPTVVQSKLGHNILVVQASAYCKYLGNITVLIDESGEMVDYSGEPIFLDTTVPQSKFYLILESL